MWTKAQPASRKISCETSSCRSSLFSFSLQIKEWRPFPSASSLETTCGCGGPPSIPPASSDRPDQILSTNRTVAGLNKLAAPPPCDVHLQIQKTAVRCAVVNGTAFSSDWWFVQMLKMERHTLAEPQLNKPMSRLIIYTVLFVLFVSWAEMANFNLSRRDWNNWILEEMFGRVVQHAHLQLDPRTTFQEVWWDEDKTKMLTKSLLLVLFEKGFASYSLPPTPPKKNIYVGPLTKRSCQR